MCTPYSLLDFRDSIISHSRVIMSDELLVTSYDEYRVPSKECCFSVGTMGTGDSSSLLPISLLNRFVFVRVLYYDYELPLTTYNSTHSS